MKRLLFSFLAVLLFGTAAMAQTFVSTTAANKNVVLEEFTGIYCGFCPDGHAIANQISANNPGRVALVNVHTGSYANPQAGDPDFRTSFGAAFASQSSLTGYPAGTVNREQFSSSQGGGTAQSRGTWASTSGATLGQGSPVNAAVRGVVDLGTNVLTVDVEVYYTGNSASATNKVNVYLLQSKIYGPQSGGGAGNNYEHNHALRHLLTGQWGETINATTTGSFFSKTYTYSLPAMIGNIPVDPQNLEVAISVAEGNQKISSGEVQTVNISTTAGNDGALVGISNPGDICGSEWGPTVTIRNGGNNPLTSLEIQYNINSGAWATYNWTGNLATYATADVTLPAYLFTPNTIGNVAEVKVDKPNGTTDEISSNNNKTEVFYTAPVATSQTITVDLWTDANPTQTRWRLKTDQGQILDQRGPFTTPNSNDVYNITLDNNFACWTFELLDTGGDGLTGIGRCTVKDAAGNVLSFNTTFSDPQVDDVFQNQGFVGTNTVDELNSISVFPNPVSSELNVSVDLNESATVNVDVTNVTGQTVLSKGAIEMNSGSSNLTFDVSSFTNGIYFVNMKTAEGVVSQKFVVSK